MGQDAPDREPKLREFCRRFAERAFRRPLTDEQKAFFVDRQFEEAANPEAAVKRVVLLVLKSPRFLYREIGGEQPRRLRRGVAALVRALGFAPRPAAARCRGGRPARHPRAGRRQAERMVADLRARAKLREFFLQWLKVDQVPDLAKDPKRFPQFDEAVASDLRTSLDLFLEDVVWERGGRLPPAPARGLRLPERPAGAVLRRRPARRTRRSRRSSWTGASGPGS